MRDPASQEPRISVIVPTRDRPEDLERCLETVLACDHDAFEVIVVDQGEPPARLPVDSRLVHRTTRTQGKTASLNIGLTLARAELLAFTDDDCTVPPDWLRGIEELFASYPEVSMAFGELRAVDHDPDRELVPENRIDDFEVVRRIRNGQIPGGAGANMAARRTAFEAIGAWDEQFGPGARFRSCEEGDMVFRALTEGHAVARVPTLAVTHWGVRSWADGSGRTLILGYAYGRGAVIGKHLRRGDPHMVPIAAREMIDDFRVVASGLAHRRRTGLGQVAQKWRGLAAGLTAPVHRGNL